MCNRRYLNSYYLATIQALLRAAGQNNTTVRVQFLGEYTNVANTTLKQ